MSEQVERSRPNYFCNVVVVCSPDVSFLERDAVRAVVTAFGGTWTYQLEKGVTHIVTNGTEMLDSDWDMLDDYPVIVTQQWVIDCVSREDLVSSEHYLLALSHKGRRKTRYDLEAFREIMTDTETMCKLGIDPLDLQYPTERPYPPWVVEESKAEREQLVDDLRQALIADYDAGSISKNSLACAKRMSTTINKHIATGNETYLTRDDKSGELNTTDQRTNTFAECLVEKHDGFTLLDILHAQMFDDKPNTLAAYEKMHEFGGFLDQTLLLEGSRVLGKADLPHRALIVYCLPFMCGARYHGMTRTPRQRYDQHDRVPENSFVEEFRKTEECPKMTITYECRPSLPLLGAFALETSIIACSGTSLANLSPHSQPAQANSISGNIPNILGRMRITLRRPALLRWYYIGQVMASRRTSALPAKDWHPDSRFATEHEAAWKVILGEEITPLLTKNGYSIQTFTRELFQPHFRRYIDKLEKQLRVSSPIEFQIRSKWEGKRGGIEKRTRAVLKSLEASQDDDAPGVAGMGRKVWIKRVADTSSYAETKKAKVQQWTNLANKLSPDKRAALSRPADGALLKVAKNTTKDQSPFTSTLLPLPPQTLSTLTEGTNSPRNAIETADDKAWRTKIIRKSVNYYMIMTQTTLKETHHACVSGPKSVSKKGTFDKWLNTSLRPRKRFTLQEIVDALADQNEAMTIGYRGRIVENPLFCSDLLQFRMKAARQVAQENGFTVPDFFLAHFVGDIQHSSPHWAWSRAKLQDGSANLFYDALSDAPEPTISQMEDIITLAFESILKYDRREVRCFVQDETHFPRILSDMLHPHCPSMERMEPLLKEFRKASKRYGPILEEETDFLEFVRQLRINRQKRYNTLMALKGKKSTVEATEDMRMDLVKRCSEIWGLVDASVFVKWYIWMGGRNAKADPKIQLVNHLWWIEIGHVSSYQVDNDNGITVRANSDRFSCSDLFAHRGDQLEYLHFRARQDRRAQLQSVLREVASLRSLIWHSYGEMTATQLGQCKQDIAADAQLCKQIYTTFIAKLVTAGETPHIAFKDFRGALVEYLVNYQPRKERGAMVFWQPWEIQLMRQFWIVEGDIPDAVGILAPVLGRTRDGLVKMLTKYPGLVDVPTNGMQPQDTSHHGSS